MNFHSEGQRYDYPLTQDSTVVDVGGYHGEFSAKIYDKYGCAIWCFEPVSEFRAIIRARNIPRLTLLPCALSNMTGIVTIMVNGDSTGMFKEDGTAETVLLMDAADALGSLPKIDLLKLNIEGSEYAVLRRMIDQEIQRKCRNIQVQFHCIPNSDRRMAEMRGALLVTHKLTWGECYVWENWRLKA